MRRIIAPKKSRPVRHAADVGCQVVRLRDFRLVADCILDISENGLLVGPADTVMTGEPVIVSFRLPFWGRWIDTEATVARVVHGRRPGEGQRALGLAMDPLERQSARLLELAMRWLPAAPPGARPGRRSSLGGLLHSFAIAGSFAMNAAMPSSTAASMSS